MNHQKIHEEIAKVAPIEGINFYEEELAIIFKPEATEEEKDLAQAIADSWDDPPEPQWKAFGETISIAPAYLRNTTHNNTTLGLKSTLELMLKVSSDGDLRLESIKDLWNAIAVQSNPTSEEIAVISEIIEANKIDQFFFLKVDGTMVLT